MVRQKVALPDHCHSVVVGRGWRTRQGLPAAQPVAEIGVATVRLTVADGCAYRLVLTDKHAEASRTAYTGVEQIAVEHRFVA